MPTAFDTDALRQRLADALPQAQIDIRDLTGHGDHYAVEVVSGLFEGLNAIARHRKVYAALTDVIGGAVHALALQTYTPQEASQRGGLTGKLGAV